VRFLNNMASSPCALSCGNSPTTRVRVCIKLLAYPENASCEARQIAANIAKLPELLLRFPGTADISVSYFAQIPDGQGHRLNQI
jgi:hypothetical protein